MYAMARRPVQGTPVFQELRLTVTMGMAVPMTGVTRRGAVSMPVTPRPAMTEMPAPTMIPVPAETVEELP